MAAGRHNPSRRALPGAVVALPLLPAILNLNQEEVGTLTGGGAGPTAMKRDVKRLMK